MTIEQYLRAKFNSSAVLSNENISVALLDRSIAPLADVSAVPVKNKELAFADLCTIVLQEKDGSSTTKKRGNFSDTVVSGRSGVATIGQLSTLRDNIYKKYDEYVGKKTINVRYW